jgi:hypothetical protein
MEALSAASGKQRVAAWGEMAAVHRELPPAELAQAVLGTLGYNDRAAQRAVEETLKQALGRGELASALLSALCATSARSGGEQQAQVLLRWSALLAPHVDAASADFGRLAGVQSALLARLMSGTPQARRCAPREPARRGLGVPPAAGRVLTLPRSDRS